MTLDEANALPAADFVARFGGVFEHSPWVAAAVAGQRPFASVDALHAAMCDAVDAAGEAAQLELLRAHPELAGRAAIAGELTADSAHEQDAAGLLACSALESSALQHLNATYRQRFGFPFIVAVRGLDRAMILARLDARLQHTQAEEFSEALGQVKRIALLRLQDQITAAPAGTAPTRAPRQPRDDHRSLLAPVKAWIARMGMGLRADPPSPRPAPPPDDLSGLVDQEQVQSPWSDPVSGPRLARAVAEGIARLYADTPAHYTPFAAADLAPALRRWYDAQRDALEALGFSLAADLESSRITEAHGRRVLLRLLLSADRLTLASAWRVTLPAAELWGVELVSESAPGRWLSTSAVVRPAPFHQPEAFQALVLPGDTTLDQLVRTHLSRLEGQSLRPVPDVDAALAMGERMRAHKRDAARARAWVDDGELRALLGLAFDELAPRVRAELARLL